MVLVFMMFPYKYELVLEFELGFRLCNLLPLPHTLQPLPHPMPQPLQQTMPQPMPQPLQQTMQHSLPQPL
jgi:hypothetical protein